MVKFYQIPIMYAHKSLTRLGNFKCYASLPKNNYFICVKYHNCMFLLEIYIDNIYSHSHQSQTIKKLTEYNLYW